MLQKSAPKYFSQIASIPYLGDLFTLEELPIYRQQLYVLLRDIDPVDKEYLESIEKFFMPHKENFNISNQEYIKRLESLLDRAPSQTLYSLIFEIHAIDITAKSMTCIKAGQPLNLLVPSNNKDVQELSTHILRYKDDIYFSMQYTRPWVKDFYTLLQKEYFYSMQRVLLDVKWKLFSYYANYNFFNFEALVIYVLKWQFARLYLISKNKPNVRDIVLATVKGGEHDTK